MNILDLKTEHSSHRSKRIEFS